MKTPKKIYNELSELETDEDRWWYVYINRNEENLPPVLLDNDLTCIPFLALENEDSEDSFCIYFDNYVGWADGLFSLFKVLGIKHESV